MRLNSESPMLYRSALHGNWNALSLAGRALKDKLPTPTVPLTVVLPNRQVFLQDLYKIGVERLTATWHCSQIPARKRTTLNLHVFHISRQIFR
jgi:hypothetical protein